jgi:hypothetical protein
LYRSRISSSETQPVDPFGRSGSRTFSQPSLRARWTRNTSLPFVDVGFVKVLVIGDDAFGFS